MKSPVVIWSSMYLFFVFGLGTLHMAVLVHFVGDWNSSPLSMLVCFGDLISLIFLAILARLAADSFSDQCGYRIIRQDELEPGKTYRRINAQPMPCVVNHDRTTGEDQRVKDMLDTATHLVSAVCPNKTVRLIALDCDPPEYFLQAHGDTRILKGLRPVNEKRDGGEAMTSAGEVIVEPFSAPSSLSL